MLCAFAMALFAAPATAAERDTWRHGVIVAKHDAGFVFMAAERGFDARFGVDIEIAQFRSDAIALRALISGDLDSYEGSPGAAMIAVSQGAPVKITGCYWPQLTYGIFARAEVNGVADLAGRTIAISNPGAFPHLMILAVLNQNGIAADSVRFAPMGGDLDRFQALIAGIADAAAVSTELVPEAEARGLKLLVHAQEAMPEYLRYCIYMTEDTIAGRGEIAARYLAAQMTAMRYALENRDAVIELTREIMTVDETAPEPGYIYDEVIRYSAITPDMMVPPDRLAWMQELLLETGSLRTPIDVGAMIDMSVRDEALSNVGLLVRP